MRHLYTAPSATVDTTPPATSFRALQTPGLPAWSLVLVEHWVSHEAEDAWLALSGVSEHYIENWGNAAPQAAITAFAPWGAVAGMTLRQLVRLIQQNGAPWCRL
ncbi:MAG TPA: hypothetical protein VNG95_05095 [Gemmatimonadales bacterium]|nr:hypothetical protein [Gemmatimonadales bacterium]